MSTHNIGFYGEAILMSTHNIGFNEEISKIITQLSSNTHLISSAGYLQTITAPVNNLYLLISLFLGNF